MLIYAVSRGGGAKVENVGPLSAACGPHTGGGRGAPPPPGLRARCVSGSPLISHKVVKAVLTSVRTGPVYISALWCMG